MNQTGQRVSSWKAAVIAAAVSFCGWSTLWAQPRPKPAPAPAPAPAAPAPAAASPAEMLEERVMMQLAEHGMDSTLTHYFEKYKVPEAKRGAIKGAGSIKDLENPKIPASRKRTLLIDAAKGIDLFLANARDTNVLMARANIFVEHGMTPQINQIEYFGETTARQLELRAAGEAVAKIFDKVAKECELQQNEVVARAGKQMSEADQKKWQQLEERMQAARWNKAFGAYGYALGIETSSDTNRKLRKEVAMAAINFLKDFESPDIEREAMVRIQIGKLFNVAGEPDKAILKLKEAQKFKATKAEHYESRFHIALTNLMAARSKPCEAAVKELVDWCKQNFTGEELKAVSAGVGLLQYRMYDLMARESKIPQQQRGFVAEGDKVLTQVMKDNPKLEPTIKRMLLEKLPPDADVTKLDTVLLSSLMAQGVDEYRRAGDDDADDKGKGILERAIKAAQTIEKRASDPANKVNEDVLEDATFYQPLFTTKLGSGRNKEVIVESLAYLKDHGKKKTEMVVARRQNVMGIALYYAREMERDNLAMARQENIELVNQVYQTAIAEGLVVFRLHYGKRLVQAKKYTEAREQFKAVPPTDPKMALSAKYYEFSCVAQMMAAEEVSDDDKKKLADEMVTLAPELLKRLDTALASPDPKQVPWLKSIRAQVAVDTSGIFMARKDYAKAVAALEKIEEFAAGDAGIMATVLHRRVVGYLALEKVTEAVTAVKKLVEAGTANAEGILGYVLNYMKDDYFKAREKYEKDKKPEDAERMKMLSSQQTELARMLVATAAGKDPEKAYDYAGFQATVLLYAAHDEADQAKRDKYLAEISKTIPELQALAPKLLKATQEKLAAKPDDAALQKRVKTLEDDMSRYPYMLALIAYELKDYKKAKSELGPLVSQGKLGQPQSEMAVRDPVTNTVEIRIVENTTYWEGLLRYMQATYELSLLEPTPENKEANAANARVLKLHYTSRHDAKANSEASVGGTRLGSEYDKLRAKMLPGWDPKADVKTPAPEK